MQVFERSAEIDKFCCRSCFLRSAAVRAQLEAEPLWIRGDEQGNFAFFYACDSRKLGFSGSGIP